MQGIAMPNSSFGFNSPEDSPGFLLWQVTAEWQRKIKVAIEPLGITQPQFVICALLLWFNENNISPTQVALIEKSKLDKMTVSASLKKLSDKNLIQREESPSDTRAKLSSLTPQGKRLIKKAVKIVENIDHLYFSKLNKKDLSVLKNILYTLVSK